MTSTPARPDPVPPVAVGPSTAPATPARTPPVAGVALRLRDHIRSLARRHRRALVTVVAILVVAALVVAVRGIMGPDRGPVAPPPPAPRSAPDGIRIAPNDEFMNDPQRPFLLDGVWHAYALVNGDHPGGNGSSWRHYTSPDMVTWHDEGIAIDKYDTPLGDAETGSVVVDTANTSGLGAGTVVAILTQQSDGVQRQSLYSSTDGGYRFAPYAGNPVMDNPGGPDFRDPKVVWDGAHGRWSMALAEGRRIGFYTSPDLIHWTYRSDFARDDLGTLETPDVFPLASPDDPGRVRWVLAAGADGSAEGRGTGTAYWVGDFDGERFTPDDAAPRWLDRGADLYAAVTWADPADDPAAPTRRYAMGWASSWAYARQLPLRDGGSGGAQSIVRELRLEPDGAGWALRSTPLDALAGREGEARPVADARVSGTTPLADGPGGPSRLRLTLTPDPADPARETRVRLASPEGGTVTVGYDAERRQAFVVRDDDPDGIVPDAYDRPSTAPLPASAPGDPVTLDLVVDDRVLEAFVDGDAAVLTTATVGSLDGAALSVEAVDGTTRVTDASWTAFDAAG
ncbi:glycoside hydrolase family 32 protein [Clavibacter tessellarius]|uniref:Glycosyl hydrolase family 32 n=1 Tax=Clavibacter tessellarius TaxID=31965 RepID=A0A225CHW7_9MICO|nr:glycoside hydrolase family 32 protein [Clavibacter michiganensis]OQJ62006.1 glycosyl hydrolase family 32 [Clavibacter michiganensis subsp. tessellarius]UKF34997.1 glycoside hydrolase family 32 protein [Clavibacter michiganensis subsp. tessellarius]